MVKIVKIGRLGEAVQEIPFQERQTVSGLLERTGMQLGQEDLQVNGQRVPLNITLNPGDIVLIVPRVSGGSRS